MLVILVNVVGVVVTAGVSVGTFGGLSGAAAGVALVGPIIVTGLIAGSGSVSLLVGGGSQPHPHPPHRHPPGSIRKTHFPRPK